jgi:hypothetical protein
MRFYCTQLINKFHILFYVYLKFECLLDSVHLSTGFNGFWNYMWLLLL